jgi:hypothetical protein
MLAALRGQTETVRALIEIGASKDVQDAVRLVAISLWSALLSRAFCLHSNTCKVAAFPFLKRAN